MEFFVAGGSIMYFILACSIIGVAIFIDRMLNLHRARINKQEFITGLRNELKAKRITEAISICAQTPGPVASVLRAGISYYDEGLAAAKESMEKVSLQEVPRMEKGISFLASIAVICPLLGLLGTVFGLMDIFGIMSEQGGFLSYSEIAGGIWKAMLTTAFGITVAIPANLAYNYLVEKVGIIVNDMKESASELTTFMSKELTEL